MKKILTSVFLAALSFTPFISAQDYKIDTSHSAIIFGIKHMGLGNNYGRFNSFDGSISYDENNVSASSLNVTVKAASIDTDNKKRDAHLRNADFFDAGTYPTMTFTSKSFKKTSEKGVYDVTGTLTLLGTSKDISIKLTKVGQGIHFFTKKPAVGFETRFSISRKDFKFGKGRASGSLGDQVNLIVAFEALAK